MSLQFPIADMFTRIRNGLKVFRHSVSISYSNVNKAILDLLVREGYIDSYKTEQDGAKRSITVFLKYSEGSAVIDELKCVSKPSLRKYMKHEELPSVYGGLGILIVSTSKGVYSDRELRSMVKKEGVKLGGEVIGSVV